MIKLSNLLNMAHVILFIDSYVLLKPRQLAVTCKCHFTNVSFCPPTLIRLTQIPVLQVNQTRELQFLSVGIIHHGILNALIQSISTLKSPEPSLAPMKPPPCELTDRDIPTTRPGFISMSASITFPFHVGK